MNSLQKANGVSPNCNINNNTARNSAINSSNTLNVPNNAFGNRNRGFQTRSLSNAPVSKKITFTPPNNNLHSQPQPNHSAPRYTQQQQSSVNMLQTNMAMFAQVLPQFYNNNNNNYNQQPMTREQAEAEHRKYYIDRQYAEHLKKQNSEWAPYKRTNNLLPNVANTSSNIKTQDTTLKKNQF